MLKIADFKFFLGETIINYQLIEHDLKLIYAGILKGDFNKNIAFVQEEFHGLGQIIHALQDLDNSSSKPYFTNDDYRLLKSVARERNYFCHQCSVDFCYYPNFLASTQYKDACIKLEKANKDTSYLQKQTEKIRIELLRKLKRI